MAMRQSTVQLRRAAERSRRRLMARLSSFAAGRQADRSSVVRGL
jgi:hypothetical protein